MHAGDTQASEKWLFYAKIGTAIASGATGAGGVCSIYASERVCNHYCVRERRFIFSALFCQLKEIRARKPTPHAQSAAARGLVRIAQQQRERPGPLLQRAARKLYGTPRVRFASSPSA